jgi:hypothetical protein
MAKTVEAILPRVQLHPLQLPLHDHNDLGLKERAPSSSDWDLEHKIFIPGINTISEAEEVREGRHWAEDGASLVREGCLVDVLQELVCFRQGDLKN